MGFFGTVGIGEGSPSFINSRLHCLLNTAPSLVFAQSWYLHCISNQKPIEWGRQKHPVEIQVFDCEYVVFRFLAIWFV